MQESPGSRHHLTDGICSEHFTKRKELMKYFLIFLFAAQALAAPNKIVSVSLASDEILLELLTTCKKKSALVAVSAVADRKSSSYIYDQVKDIPARVHSEPESVLKLKPDLVIAATFNRPELLDLLRKKNIPLLVLEKFSSHQDIAENIRLIGQATGCEKEADVMIKTFLAKIQALRTAGAKQKLETAVSWSSDLTVMAAGTLFDDLLTMNHLENAASKAGLKEWPRISPESLRKWNPDWVVIGCDDDCTKIEALVKNDPAWRNLNAVKNGRFIRVLPRALVNASQYFGTELKRI